MSSRACCRMVANGASKGYLCRIACFMLLSVEIIFRGTSIYSFIYLRQIFTSTYIYVLNTERNSLRKCIHKYLGIIFYRIARYNANVNNTHAHSALWHMHANTILMSTSERTEPQFQENTSICSKSRSWTQVGLLLMKYMSRHGREKRNRVSRFHHSIVNPPNWPRISLQYLDGLAPLVRGSLQTTARAQLTTEARVESCPVSSCPQLFKSSIYRFLYIISLFLNVRCLKIWVTSATCWSYGITTLYLFCCDLFIIC
jgi:hypothetical protein